MGVGGAGLALGGIFTAGWQNRVDETCARYENSRCLVLDPSNPQVNDDVNAIGSMRTGATASFVVGGAAFATGTALLIRSLALRSQAESVSVYVSPMGIALRGRF